MCRKLLGLSLTTGKWMAQKYPLGKNYVEEQCDGNWRGYASGFSDVYLINHPQEAGVKR